MKAMIILRDLPIPVYVGLNLVIHNVLKGLMEKHQILVLVLDKEYPADKSMFFAEYESYEYCEKKVYGGKIPVKISRVAHYYRTERDKLIWLENKIKAYKPDRIIGFGYDLLGYFGLLDSNVPKILDLIDSEVLFLWRDIKQGHMGPSHWKHLIASVFIAKCIKKCDAVITVSDEDTLSLKRLLLCNNIFTIPNGVDLNYYCPDDNIEKEEGQIVFVGSLNWPPNWQGIQWFLKKCWGSILKECPHAKLIIIGKNPTQVIAEFIRSYPNVELKGFVEDIRDYIRRSQVSIAPMISGSGIKNKILEAWALGQPVVSTYLGARNLVCKNDVNILLGDSPGSFSKQIIRLLGDKNLRHSIAAGGRANVIANYSWEKITNEFNGLIERV
jgi:glycosyltransferase involved in cell wall biosynthesis